MIDTVGLFRPLDEKLIEVLSSLTPEEWLLPTGAGQWQVKDVAAHLLDGSIRNISAGRDGHAPRPAIATSDDFDLIHFLNELNRTWVESFRRVSPAMLLHLLKTTGPLYTSYIESLDPMGEALYPVAWAGETTSKNWFHIAREYTEKWHHQQQIREATGRSDLLTEKYYSPVMATFMLALPYTMRNTEADPGTMVDVIITGAGGGTWTVQKGTDWEFVNRQEGRAAAETTIEGSVAWKLFCKNVSADQIKGQYSITGDQSLGSVVLRMISVMGAR
jgi:uncharacterized protein (TIGR03083 family)